MHIENGYQPFPRQKLFHESKAKFRAIISGVGFGKSAAGANELLKTAIEYPKSMHLILAPTSKIMTYATLNQFWKFCPKEIVKYHGKSDCIIYLQNGARIIYLTADNERNIDRLRGIEIGSFWSDESRLQMAYVWNVLLTRLRDKNGPLRGFITTTPFGFNWIYSYFFKKQHPLTKEPLRNPDDYEYFTGSTFDNPYTPKDYKINLDNQFSGNFKRQELYGEFKAFEGQVYDNFNHEVHIIKENQVPKIFKEIIAGLDFGFINPTACLIIGLDGDDRIYVLDEYYLSRQNIEDVGNWLLNSKYYKQLVTTYADPSEPMHISKLNDMGLSVVPANNEVMPGINLVHSMFDVQKDGKARIYVHKRCKNIIDEINNYRYAEKKEGKEEKDEPIKTMDHATDALRYAVFTHLGQSNQFTILDDPWA